MKKLLLGLFLAVAVSFSATAQLSYGVRAGVNLAKISVKSEGLTINPSNNVGFNLTAYMDAPIAPGLSIQPGISLQNKGMKFDFGGFIEDDWVVDEDIPDKYTLSLMYLEVPVNLVYYLPAGSGDVFLGAGPYLGIGIGGKEKYGSVSEDVVWGDDGFKRLDAGANFLLGYKLLNGFTINAGYGLGLMNMDGEGGDYGTAKNRVLSFGVGFQF